MQPPSPSPGIALITTARFLAIGLSALLSGCFVLLLPHLIPCGERRDGLCVPEDQRYRPSPIPNSPYVAENMTFGVSLDSQGKPVFSAPAGLKNRPYYVLNMFVSSSPKNAWEVVGVNRSGARLPDEMRFNPDIPIVYGEPPKGTFEVTSEKALRLGQRYVFFANLAYENESGSIEHAKGRVAFTLIGTGNTPQSIQSSPTRYDGRE